MIFRFVFLFNTTTEKCQPLKYFLLWNCSNLQLHCNISLLKLRQLWWKVAVWFHSWCIHKDIYYTIRRDVLLMFYLFVLLRDGTEWEYCKIFAIDVDSSVAWRKNIWLKEWIQKLVMVFLSCPFWVMKYVAFTWHYNFVYALSRTRLHHRQLFLSHMEFF